MNVKSITALLMGFALTFAMSSVSSAYEDEYQSGASRGEIVAAEQYGGVASDALGSIVDSDLRAPHSATFALNPGYDEAAGFTPVEPVTPVAKYGQATPNIVTVGLHRGYDEAAGFRPGETGEAVTIYSESKSRMVTLAQHQGYGKAAGFQPKGTGEAVADYGQSQQAPRSVAGMVRGYQHASGFKRFDLPKSVVSYGQPKLHSKNIVWADQAEVTSER